jgi:hypothetical protein
LKIALDSKNILGDIIMKNFRIFGALLLIVFGLALSVNSTSAADSKLKTVEIKTLAPTTQVQSEIENSLYELAGVKNVSFDKKNVVKVDFDGTKLSGDEIVYFLSEKGYSAEIVKSNDTKSGSMITTN